MNEWKSESIDKLVPALLKAQMHLQPVIKDCRNPAFPKSKYAELSSVLEAINEAFHPNGLMLTQLPTTADAGFVLKTVILHTSGQWIASDLPMSPDMTNPQKVGGAITYARRYGAAAAAGLQQEDDDGETANGRGHGYDYDRNPVGNGNGNGPRPGGNGPAPSNGSESGRIPTSGKGLFAWTKDMEQRYEVGLLKYLNEWSKLQDFPGRMVDWDAEQVKHAHAEAVRKLNSIATVNNGHGDAREGD